MQLTQQRTIAIPRQAGTLLLGGLLIAVGAVALLQLHSPVMSAVLNLTAILTGAVILWERRNG